MRFMSLGENGISTSEWLQQGFVNRPAGVDIGMSEAPETGGDWQPSFVVVVVVNVVVRRHHRQLSTESQLLCKYIV